MLNEPKIAVRNMKICFAMAVASSIGMSHYLTCNPYHFSEILMYILLIKYSWYPICDF
jgi:hypothetical protein